MEEVKWNYFQYRKGYDYPVYLRIRQDEATPKFLHLLTEMGFGTLSELEVRKIPLQRAHTRMLSIQSASSRLQLQINGPDLLDKYGSESLSLQMGMPVYTYKKVGVMGLPHSKTLWELAINSDIFHTDQMVGVRVMLIRFLSQALASEGVLCYWGTVKDGSVIVMKQQDSFGEAVVIDVNKKMIFSNGDMLKISPSLKIIRKDKDAGHSGNLSREDIIGFLSVSTCLLSFQGITQSMKASIYKLSANVAASYGKFEQTINL